MTPAPVPPFALDALPAAEACRRLYQCCGATHWAQAVAAGRPYGGGAALLAAAERQFAALTRADWLEAFAQHPRIGDLAGLRERFAATAHLAGAEQGGVRGADEATLAALAAANAAYERRFGHIFIVCASGKTAAEMLGLLASRMGNDPQTELAVAAGEQRRITRLRLAQLDAGGPA